MADAAQAVAIADAAQAAVIANAAQAAVIANPAPAAAIAATYGRTPAEATRAVFLDYTTAAGAKLFHQATLSLDPKFDGLKDSSLRTLLNGINDRGTMQDWSQILNVPTSSGPRNITKQHGLLTLEGVRDHVKTFIGLPVKSDQLDTQLLHCLKATMSTTVANRVNLKADQFTFEVDGKKFESGVCLLMCLVSEYTVSTSATKHFLMGQISGATTMLAELDFNVERFFDWFNEKIADLEAHGYPTDGLEYHVMAALLTITQPDFRQYINSIHHSTHDGVEVSSSQLERRATQLYRTMVEAKTWDMPTKADKALIAMEATVKKAAADKDKKKTKFEMPAWRKIAPAAGETPTKVVNTRTWHWCGLHKMWCGHLESDCRAKPAGADAAPPPTSATSEPPTDTASQLRLQAAFAVLTNDS
jgi:hypothetical protein